MKSKPKYAVFMQRGAGWEQLSIRLSWSEAREFLRIMRVTEKNLGMQRQRKFRIKTLDITQKHDTLAA